MSFNDGFNQTSTTGRNEGFTDSTQGSNSYGQGTGSGAYDPTNTGLSGYGSNQNQRTDMDSFGGGGDRDLSSRGDRTDFSRAEGDFSSNRGGSGMGGLSGNRSGMGDMGGNDFDNNTSSGTGGAFGRDRGLEKPGFTGTDSQFGNTETGGTFNRSGDLGSSTRGGLDNMQSRDRDNFDPSGPRDDQFGGETHREREGGKPSFGDKMRGTAEKLAGSVTGNHDLKERGIERKQGEF